MATELAAAYVTLMPSLKGAQSSITSQLGGMDFSAAGRAMGGSLSKGLGKSADGLAAKLTSVGKSASGMFGKVAKPAIGAIAGIGTAVAGLAAKGGMTRALNLEQAKTMFKGLKKDWDQYAGTINDAVTGTAFSMDQAALVAANLAASGVGAGKQMETALNGAVGAAATFGADLGDIGGIYQKVAAQGKLMGDNVYQLSARGINATSVLAEQLGKTQDEVSEMVSAGEIDFETFSKAMHKAFGDSAQQANNTFTGSMTNMRAALNRLGEKFATPFTKSMVPVFNGARLAINQLSASMQPLADRFAVFAELVSTRVSNGLQKFAWMMERGATPLEALKGALREAIPAETLAKLEGLARAAGALVSALAAVGAAGKALQLMGAGVKAVAPLADAFGNLGPAASSAFKSLGSTASGAFASLKSGASTVRGVMSALGSSFSTFGKSLYHALVPSNVREMFSTMSKELAFGLMAAKQTLAESFGGVRDSVSSALSSVASAIDSKLGGIPGRVASALGGFKSAVGESFGNAMDTLRMKLGATDGIAAKFGGLGQAASAALGKVGSVAGTVGTGFATAVGTMGKGVTMAVGAVGALSAGLLGLGAAAALGQVNLAEKMQGVLDTMAQLTQGLPAMAQEVATALPQFLEQATAMVGPLSEAFMTAFQSIADALPEILPALISAITALVGQLAPALVSMAPVLLGAGLQLFMGIVQALIQVTPQIVAQLPALVSQLAGMLAANAGQILSAGIQLFVGLVTALVQVAPQVISALIAVLPLLAQSVVSAMPQMLAAGKQLFNAIGQALTEVGPMIWDALTHFVTHLPEILIDGITGLADGAGQLFGALVDGITGQGQPAEGAAAGVASGAVDAAVQNSDASAAAEKFQSTFQPDMSAIQVEAVSGIGDVNAAVANAVDMSDAGKKASETAASSIDVSSMSPKSTEMVNKAMEAAKAVDVSSIGSEFSKKAAGGIDTSAMSSAAAQMVSNASKANSVTQKVSVKVDTSGVAALRSAASSATSAFQGVASAVASAMSRASASASSAASSISGAMSRAASAGVSAAARISSAIRSIPSSKTISFGFSMPHIPVPHYSISGSLDPKNGSVPTVSAWWGADGGILTKATIFGAGEAGPEAVLPLSKLPGLLGLDDGGSGGDVFNINLNYTRDADAADMVRDLQAGVRRLRKAGAL